MVLLVVFSRYVDVMRAGPAIPTPNAFSHELCMYLVPNAYKFQSVELVEKLV